ncbi:cephalosporin hydroxylase family protein [Pokkaliibacter sp. MBI-7]|uniref:cephalosporin hydroxylase family protein n=1 Tax=Pokkaliibacter sp. MBI-7 TaxID=3040600 RepID=UPI002447CA76|nr:cephalosporin hydroxylase family protein [Pokkaliibacter sp. MBI-7]MDH2431281.1 cephalosporin hydroxylase family protein [Pokkaliibacter sp. MBI-7]
MNPHELFQEEVKSNIKGLGDDQDMQALSRVWIREVARHKWAYNFSWLGRPAIQFPNDAWGLQEIIWKVKPDLIIETGIAHGGSLIFSASMLAMLDMCEAIESGKTLDPKNSSRKVIGIDIDIRSHNREAIEAHPMASRITMLEGSSISDDIVAQVHTLAEGYKSVLVCLDSNHTHDHVLAELKAYASLVTPGSYCVVYDTLIEDMPADMFPDRPWGPGNSPKTAVMEFLKNNKEFFVDKHIQHKLQITVAVDGFLCRSK